MYNKIKSIIFVFLLISFFFFVVFYYFSEKNVIKIANNRVDSLGDIKKKIDKIPLLKNDTADIVDYNYSNVEKKKPKKRYFWKLLDNKDE